MANKMEGTNHPIKPFAEMYQRHKKLFITLDAIAILAQVYFFVWPFLAYYLQEQSYDVTGKWGIATKLMLIDSIPFSFGIAWLQFRFVHLLNRPLFYGYTLNMLWWIILLSWLVAVRQIQPYQP